MGFSLVFQGKGGNNWSGQRGSNPRLEKRVHEINPNYSILLISIEFSKLLTCSFCQSEYNQDQAKSKRIFRANLITGQRMVRSFQAK